MEVKKNDIVQADESTGIWCGVLLVVSEVKKWGIQGYCNIPGQGLAYMRLRNGEFEVVGHAVLTLKEDDEHGENE